MYNNKKRLPDITEIEINDSYEGEQLETKIRRILNNKEPLTDGAPLIYTERKEGVLPGYDIRTDRFEVAIDAMDKVTKSHQAKREERLKLGEEAKKGMEKEDSGAKPIQGTEEKK